MPRFVILEHDHPFLHWDLMLEDGSVLKTWRLAQAPEQGGKPIEAAPLGDHRALYLDYEGPVSGGRGMVRRWDAGEYEWHSDVRSDYLELRLLGQRLQCLATLRKTESTWWFTPEH